MTLKTAIPEINDAQMYYLYSLLTAELMLTNDQRTKLEELLGFTIKL